MNFGYVTENGVNGVNSNNFGLYVPTTCYLIC